MIGRNGAKLRGIMGRKSSYTPEIAARICERLEAGESLLAICRSDDMPATSAVYRWMEDVPSFRNDFARAKTKGLDRMAEALIDISDEADARALLNGEDVQVVMDSTAVARNRLRVDTRKWYLSKLAPKLYGERLAVEHSGAVELVGAITAARQRAAAAPPADDAGDIADLL